MSKAHGFRQALVVELERRRHRRIEDFDLESEHFDFTRDEIRIRRPRRTQPDPPGDRNAIFVTQLFADGERFGAVRIANDLHQPLAVAEIDKDDPTMVTPAMNPA